MTLVPEDAFRELLADLSGDAFVAFVADLWRARGHEVVREGDRLHVDDGTLLVVERVDPAASRDGDQRPVSATPLPEHAPDDAVGPDDLRRMLLYGVERERAAELFEEQFDRPLDGDWSDWRGWLGGGEAPDAAAGDGDRETAAGGPVPAVGAAAGRLRALAGDRRVQVLVVVALLAGPAVWWGLFVHEPATESPGDPPFTMARSDAPLEGSFRVTASAEFALRGERLSFERVHTYVVGDPAVSLTTWRIGRPVGSRTTVRYHVGDRRYSRTTLTNGSQFRAVRPPADGSAGTVVVDEARSVYQVDQTTGTPDARLTPTVPMLLLSELPYERAGTTTYEGRDVVRYVPTSGWILRDVDPSVDPTKVLVQSASGAILVDGSDRLLYADVEARTVVASTWGDVLGNDSRTLSVDYRTEFGPERPARPPWVDGLRNRTAGAPLVDDRLR
jgi:hypothetical protein